jgi:hypothetical protein
MATMKFSNTLLSAFVVLVSLSACGKQATRKAAASVQNTQTTGEQTAFQDQVLKQMATEAKCQNEIPVDKAPEGFKEVKLSELQGAKSTSYALALVRTNAAVLAADNHIVSGSSSSAVELDAQMKMKSVVSSIDCKEVYDGDQLELSASPVLVMDASNGAYTERLGLRFLLEAADNTKVEKAYEADVTDTYFSELKNYEKDRLAMQTQGEGLIIKAYKDKDGNLEIRKSQMKKTKLYSQKMLLNTAFTFRAVLVQDGGLK